MATWYLDSISYEYSIEWLTRGLIHVTAGHMQPTKQLSAIINDLLHLPKFTTKLSF